LVTHTFGYGLHVLTGGTFGSAVVYTQFPTHTHTHTRWFTFGLHVFTRFTHTHYIPPCILHFRLPHTVYGWLRGLFRAGLVTHTVGWFERNFGYTHTQFGYCLLLGLGYVTHLPLGPHPTLGWLVGSVRLRSHGRLRLRWLVTGCLLHPFPMPGLHYSSHAQVPTVGYTAQVWLVIGSGQLPVTHPKHHYGFRFSWLPHVQFTQFIWLREVAL